MQLGLILIPAQANALNKEQRFEIERRYWYDKTDCSIPTNTTGTEDFSGSNNGEIAFNFLKGKGLTNEQSAGIVGNMQLESGIDPRAINSIGATGIIQWLGGRRDALYSFSQANGEDPLTLQAQLKYLWHEMTETAEAPNFNAFKNETANDSGAEGAAHAALVFESKIERSGGAGLPQRQEYARQAFALFSGNSGSTNGGTGDPCDTVSVNGAGGIDVFPQQITQSQVRAGVDGAVWCFSATTNCHHDYNAADLHAVTGTPVLAAKAGTVVATTNTSCGVGSRVTIKGDDNQFIYYYAHMGINTIAVAEGQTVAVGQEIGKVGTSCDAMGTAPHTHFDMLPADRYDRRPSCSGSSCSSFPFVDVQPNLKQLYDQLPN